MFCPKCGENNPDEALFCKNCGEVLPKNNEKRDTIEPQKQLKQPIKIDKKISKSMKIMAVEVLALVVLVAINHQVSKKFYSPEAIAKKFVMAESSGKYGEMYNLIHWGEESKSSFKKEDFVTAQNLMEQSDKLGEITIKGIHETNMAEKTKKTRTVSVKYVTGEYGAGASEIRLIKDKGRWWVNESGKYLAPSISIYVPQGAKMKIDNKDISKDLKTSQEEGCDRYDFSTLYQGTHLIELSNKEMKTEKYLFNTKDVDEKSSNIYLKMNFKDKVLQDLIKKANDDLASFFDSAAKGKNVNDVATINEMSTENKKSGINQYNHMKDYVLNSKVDTYNTIFENLSLSDGTGTATVTSTDTGRYAIKVSLDSAFNYKYKTISSYDLEEKEEIETDRVENSFTYYYEDGKWLLYDFECYDYY